MYITGCIHVHVVWVPILSFNRMFRLSSFLAMNLAKQRSLIFSLKTRSKEMAQNRGAVAVMCHWVWPSTAVKHVFGLYTHSTGVYKCVCVCVCVFVESPSLEAL